MEIENPPAIYIKISIYYLLEIPNMAPLSPRNGTPTLQMR